MRLYIVNEGLKKDTESDMALECVDYDFFANNLGWQGGLLLLVYFVLCLVLLAFLYDFFM